MYVFVAFSGFHPYVYFHFVKCNLFWGGGGGGGGGDSMDGCVDSDEIRALVTSVQRRVDSR